MLEHERRAARTPGADRGAVAEYLVPTVRVGPRQLVEVGGVVGGGLGGGLGGGVGGGVGGPVGGVVGGGVVVDGARGPRVRRDVRGDAVELHAHVSGPGCPQRQRGREQDVGVVVAADPGEPVGQPRLVGKQDTGDDERVEQIGTGRHRAPPSIRWLSSWIRAPSGRSSTTPVRAPTPPTMPRRNR